MGNDLDKIFDSFSSRNIFKDKQILQSNYTPETIPHREQEINYMAKILAPCLRLEKPSNLFVYGKTGTGKTLSIKYVGDQLIKRAKKQGTNLSILYINCKLKKVADTEYRIVAELLRKLGEKVPPTGLPTDYLYQKFTEKIDSKKQLVILILDEIDQAVKKISDEFLYNFTRMNPELRKSQISIIGISNDLIFLDNLDPRVKSSLSAEEIIFNPYNADQLQDILKVRAKKAFKENIVQQGVIAKCAAYAARNHGDARKALDLLRIAGELVERDSKKKLSFEYIDKANKQIEKERLIDFVAKSPKHFQLVLQSILYLSEKNKESSFFTTDIYSIYEKLCSKTRMEALTQRRIGDIIGEFDLHGIINFKVISRGRYGRTRDIKSAVPPHLLERVKDVLSDSLGIPFGF